MGTLANRVLTILLGVPLAFLVIATSYSVFMRYWAEQPVHWMEEVAGIAMIWIVMIGAIAAERDNDHLSIPFFVNLMGDKLRRVVALAIGVISIALLGYITYLGYLLAEQVEFKLTGVLKISWFWINIAVPIGMGACAILVLMRLFGRLPDPQNDGSAKDTHPADATVVSSQKAGNNA